MLLFDNSLMMIDEHLMMEKIILFHQRLSLGGRGVCKYASQSLPAKAKSLQTTDSTSFSPNLALTFFSQFGDIFQKNDRTYFGACLPNPFFPSAHSQIPKRTPREPWYVTHSTILASIMKL
jgi:hypothetical protein